MSEFRRIMISLPDSLLNEVDYCASMEKQSRSEFIRNAMRNRVVEIKRRQMREQLKEGYLEMAPLNLALAEEGAALERELEVFRLDNVGGE